MSTQKSTNQSVTPVSALAVLDREHKLPGITTLASNMDALFPGKKGVPCARVTEICGMAGIGKTQFCMQLCVNVQIPPSMGGLGGRALYIDTEGSFSATRLQELAQATADHVNTTLQSNIMDNRTIMDNVTIHRIFSHQQQHDIITNLDNLLQNDPEIRLIVIDSMALHYRYAYKDLAMRSRVLMGMAQTLRQVSEVHGVAVVVTNQMTTKIINKNTETETTIMVPALGESWAHACTNRLILVWHKGLRHAWLCKSPNAVDSMTPFDITMDGIRSIKP